MEANPVGGMLIEAGLAAGLTHGDGLHGPGGGDVDQHEQPPLDTLLACPAWIRRVGELAIEGGHETFEGGSGDVDWGHRRARCDGEMNRGHRQERWHRRHRQSGHGLDDRKYGDRDSDRGRHRRRNGRLRLDRRLGRRREILHGRPGAVIVVIIGGHLHRSSQRTQHADYQRRRAQRSGPSVDPFVERTGMVGRQGQKLSFKPASTPRPGNGKASLMKEAALRASTSKRLVSRKENRAVVAEPRTKSRENAAPTSV